MTPEASKSMWSRTRRSLLSRSYPNFSMVAAIVVAIVLFLGVSGIESKNGLSRVLNAQDQGICDRTLEVQLSIEDWLNAQGTACEDYTDAQLESLTGFSVKDQPQLTTLKSGDFAGMPNIANLDLQRNSLEELPADIFDGLDAVKDLRIGRNNLTDLPAGIFAGLPSLATLTADGNYFTSIDSDWFDGFEGGGTLIRFEFVGNDISEIDVDTFEGFTAPRMSFYLSYNKLRTLPVGLFDGTSPADHSSLQRARIVAIGVVRQDDRRWFSWFKHVDDSLELERQQSTTLPSGLLDNLQGLGQLRLHRNQISSLPGGLLDNNSGLYEVRLGHNNLTSLPSGFFDSNPALLFLDLNDNALTSLNGVGLVGLHDLLYLKLENNRLTQLPSDYVTSFVEDANADPPTKYCLISLSLDNNPFSSSWVSSGSLNDYLGAYGSRDPRGSAVLCAGVGDFDITDVEVLGLGGIDLGVVVTDEEKTAWELLTEDFAADNNSFDILYDFSFGWDGFSVTEDVLAAIPTYIERMVIRDATFDSAVTGASFARFTKSAVYTDDVFYRRPGDRVLGINHTHGATYVATAGLQILELDNTGLTGDGSRILSSLPGGTMRSLKVSNNPELTSVPAGITNLNNLYGLDFVGTGITSLNANAFNTMASLYFLSFEDNEISSVDENAFSGLGAVQILFLNDNEIESLDGGVLSDMTALRQVLLNDNEMLSLPSGLFAGLANLDTIQLDSNPGSPFQIGVSVVDDTTDPTMKQFHVREGAPYSFIGKIVEDGAVSDVVEVEGGATAATESFILPEGADVELPSALRGWHGNDFEFCLGLDECMVGFEFVLNPKPSIVGMRFVTQDGQLYTAGDKLRFEAQFDRDVVVEGTPQLSFELGDETRYADYVEGNPHSTLYFEYTLQETDPSPDRVSMASSMLVYRSGSSIKDPVTETVADTTPRRTEATSQALTTTTSLTINTARARISRIQPTINSVTVSGGDRVTLSVDIYGAQDIKANGLADGIGFLWSDGDAGGTIAGNGREVTYSAPDQSGTYTVSVATPFSACRAPATAEIRCAATFEIRVRRASAPVEAKAEPRNPAGVIPTILTDSDGNQYEVFTPEGGGTFTGDTSSLKAGPGVVPNGEIVGLRVAEGGSASNAGKTYQRYSLGGNWYEISAVDASNNSVSSYGLSDAVEACVPLPDALRSNISDLALVVINADDSLTILSSIVRISSSGTNVCGSLSSVPAKLAVGTAGSPAPLPTAVPDTADTSDLPDTGGAAPSSPMVVFWILIVGLASIVVGGALRRARRNSIK